MAGRRPVVGVRRRNRTLLGPEQWAWLEKELGEGTGPGRPTGGDRQPWALIGSQVVMAPILVIRVVK